MRIWRTPEQRAKRAAQHRLFRQRYPEYHRNYGRMWRKANKPKAKANLKRWRKRAQLLRTPGWQTVLRGMRQRNIRYAVELSDPYIRRLLVTRHKIKQPTQEQIEHHRIKIQTQRARRFFRTFGAGANLGA